MGWPMAQMRLLRERIHKPMGDFQSRTGRKKRLNNESASRFLGPPHTSSICMRGVRPDPDLIGRRSHQDKRREGTGANGKEGMKVRM